MPAGRFDYVKMVWQRSSAMDDQNLEERALMLARSVETHNGAGAKAWSFHVAPGKTGRDANMVLEVWGNAANNFAHSMPPAFWGYCRRLDFRRELPQMDKVAMRGFAVEQIRTGAKGVNLSVIDSRPRTKTNQRDVGGVGVTYGSRKSGRHAVVYKRGNECPAFEFRLQDAACKSFVLDVLQAWYATTDNSVSLYALMLDGIELEAASWWDKLDTGRSVSQQLTYLAEQSEELSELVEATQANKKAGRDFWNVLSDYLPGEAGAYDLTDTD